MADISFSELKRLLDYEPETGVFRWKVKSNGRLNVGDIAGADRSRRYQRIVIYRREYLAHRLAWFYVFGQWPKMIDHINGSPFDNRIANLREATPSQNCCNRRPQRRNKVGLKGVSRRKYGWEANIMHRGKAIYLGKFNTPEGAHNAYCKAARQLHGSFARVA